MNKKILTILLVLTFSFSFTRGFTQDDPTGPVILTGQEAIEELNRQLGELRAKLQGQTGNLKLVFKIKKLEEQISNALLFPDEAKCEKKINNGVKRMQTFGDKIRNFFCGSSEERNIIVETKEMKDPLCIIFNCEGGGEDHHGMSGEGHHGMSSSQPTMCVADASIVTTGDEFDSLYNEFVTQSQIDSNGNGFSDVCEKPAN